MERVFIVERYVPGLDEAAAGRAAAALARAAAELRSEGGPIRWLGSVGLPSEETDCALFVAASADLVDQAAARAGLAYERIVSGIAVRPATVGRLAARGEAAI
ncbi:MAG TPA: hypothetical protein VFW92_02550 [Candidatus Limnocylindrales bacterium]|jgi:hypothetical protein|nr:hypothetical protein [Candidatus Limnocylindrales bacterium]